MIYVYIAIFSLVLTLFFTPHFIRVFQNSKFLDIPNERKIHKSAVPLGGGVIIYAAVVLPIIGYTHDLNAVRFLLISSAFLFICGIWDDISALHWGVKLFLQTLAAVNITLFLSTLSADIFLLGLKIPYPYSYIILIVFIIGVFNAFNFLDGLDGLVSVFSAISAAVLLILGAASGNHLVLIITAALAGSLLGFLKFNSFPAKIFLGDTGALILGFFILIASLSISAVSVPGYLDLTFPLILMSAALIDAMKVIVIRIYKRKSPFQGDLNHLHHILLEKELGHKPVVFIINIFTVLFSLAAVYYLLISRTGGAVLYLILSAGFLYLQYIIYKLPNLNGITAHFIKLQSGAEVLYKKYFFPAAIFLAFGYVITKISYGAFSDRELSLIILAPSAILILLSWYSRLKNYSVNNVYVLSNLSAFLLFSGFSHSIINIKEDIPAAISNYGLILIALFALSYLAAKENIFPENKPLLTRFDFVLLTIAVLAILIFN